MRYIIFIFILSYVFLACANNRQTKINQDNISQDQAISDQTDTNQPTSELVTTDLNQIKEQNNRDNRCKNIAIKDRLILKEKTFEFDFKPFEGSCFVTTFSPEYSDPPTALELSLFKDDKQIYKFDSRFNPESVTCQIEAVSFQDLNNDNLQDVIIIGKCEAKSGDIQANEVHLNTGKKTFFTSTVANDRLENITEVKEVADFVKKNEELFFK